MTEILAYLQYERESQRSFYIDIAVFLLLVFPVGARVAPPLRYIRDLTLFVRVLFV